jgi:hypothetical protein
MRWKLGLTADAHYYDKAFGASRYFDSMNVVFKFLTATAEYGLRYQSMNQNTRVMIACCDKIGSHVVCLCLCEMLSVMPHVEAY